MLMICASEEARTYPVGQSYCDDFRLISYVSKRRPMAGRSRQNRPGNLAAGRLKFDGAHSLWLALRW
jgi:hypothetical protein